MAILLFAVHLLSAVFLLLFSIHVLRDGIEKSWIHKIQKSFAADTPVHLAVTKGTILGFAMQGATAVVLLFASLAGSGTVSLAIASVAALGAELGSAIAVQFLFLPVSNIGPFAILLGGVMFLRFTQPKIRNAGQVIVAIGLILLSLTLIRSAVAPVTLIDGIDHLFSYLNTDILTAVLFGFVLTVLMSSSIAAILTVLAIASAVGLAPMAGIAFVIGCNLGSSFLPVWMTLGETPATRTIPLTVFCLRCAGCLMVLAGLSVAPISIELEPEMAMVAGHLGINACLMLLAPLCFIIAPAINKRQSGQTTNKPAHIDSDDLAPTLVKRELAAMLEGISSLAAPNVEERSDPHAANRRKDRVRDGLQTIRYLYARASVSDRDALENLRQSVTYAIRLERCITLLNGSDQTQRTYDRQLYSENQNEMDWLADAIKRTTLIAQDVLWTESADAAHRLVAQKEAVSAFENTCRNVHLARIHEGDDHSPEGSNHYLERIAILKEVNSKVATIGYAVLDRQGGLKKTRLRAHLKVIEA